MFAPLTRRGSETVRGNLGSLTPGAGETPPVQLVTGPVTRTKPTFVSVSGPCAFVTVKVTVYVPRWVYTCEGFWSVEVPPSPKVQNQLSTTPTEESANCTVSGG